MRRLQLRVIFAQSAKLSVDISPASSVSLENLFPSSLGHPMDLPTPVNLLYLDKEPTLPSSFTALKTTCRDMYDRARARVLSSPPSLIEEALLWSPKREMMEGSFTSLYFFRGGRWVTPPAGSLAPSEPDGSLGGGQRGTTRKWALEKELCIEGRVDVDSVNIGERVWISSGVRGFALGVVSEHGA